jgi:exopolysaccharide biosynthesis polyprenyl glycosylphosphotransferase
MARPRRNDVLIPALGVLFDALAIESAFLISYWLRFNTPILKFLTVGGEKPPLGAYFYGSLVVIAVWLLLFQSRRMYGARRNVSLPGEFFDVVKLVSFGMLIVMSAAFFYREFSYSRLVFGLLWLTSVLLICSGRAALYRIEKTLYRSGRELCNAVIIGGGEAAGRIFESFHNHPLLGYRLVGYFAPAEPAPGTQLASSAYLGTYAQVASRISEGNVEMALIALPREDHQELYRMMRECEGINVEFLLVPDILELLASRMTVKEIEGIPFIKVKGMPMTSWGRISKRLFDLVLTIPLLIVCSPLFLLLAILIRLDSRGPVFFRQERVGLDGRRFRMLKFRSMHQMAESATGPVWARDDDPRRTAVGKFLRSSSLDELPQLFNVLRGEMSLVGPRPERPFFVEQFSRKDDPGKLPIPKYLDRHRMKTGMTGWAQINGLRGNTSLEERIRFDIYYIENWSLGFDLKILFRTVGALFSSNHAA